MNKKIDKNSSNNKYSSDMNKSNMKKKTTGSKTAIQKKGSKSNPVSRSPINSNYKETNKGPKRRGRRPKKILDYEHDVNDDDFDSDGDHTKKEKEKKKKTKSKNIEETESESDTESDAGSGSEERIESESESESSDGSESDTDTNPKQISSVICRLNSNAIDSNKLSKIKKQMKTREKKASKNDCDEDSDGIFKNDIPTDIVCAKCVRNEKIITTLKNKLEKCIPHENMEPSEKKIYNTQLDIISVVSGKKIKIKKTNIWCWWDLHSFTCLPFFLPEIYHSGTYYVKGCFCSPNCALAYNLYRIKDAKISLRKSLLIQMYKEFCNIKASADVDINIPGPIEELLKEFGGPCTIEQYRKKFLMNKEYVVYIPPIKPINNIVEECNNVELDITKKQYVLQRSKPRNLKGSIVESMKLAYNECDED